MSVELISAAASLMSALIAAGALIFAGLQIRLQARTSSFQVAAQFLADTRARWLDCEKAQRSSEKFSSAVGELISSFEVYCVALNDRMLVRRARLFIADTIIDYLEKMEAAGYRDYVADWVGPDHVCRELRAFAKSNKHRFARPRDVLSMLGEPL